MQRAQIWEPAGLAYLSHHQVGHQDAMSQVSMGETCPGGGGNRASVVYNAATGNRTIAQTPHRRQAALTGRRLARYHRERPEQ